MLESNIGTDARSEYGRLSIGSKTAWRLPLSG
jgi:hypothetical protein